MQKANNQRDPNWKKLHPWYRHAKAHAETNASWFEVEPGSPELDAWLTYFDKLSWCPLAFTEALRAKRNWTAPCQWPQWLGALPDSPR